MCLRPILVFTFMASGGDGRRRRRRAVLDGMDRVCITLWDGFTIAPISSSSPLPFGMKSDREVEREKGEKFPPCSLGIVVAPQCDDCPEESPRCMWCDATFGLEMLGEAPWRHLIYCATQECTATTTHYYYHHHYLLLTRHLSSCVMVGPYGRLPHFFWNILIGFDIFDPHPCFLLMHCQRLKSIIRERKSWWTCFSMPPTTLCFRKGVVFSLFLHTTT